ncbi:hypothetical protein LWC34_01180 [Kibdelosporangium philippinense]|uniref:Uncharacterized protein n=1 Tax=Kibdelosporangium philippinense TaxID=211113 RepID=A0ABS8Z0F2_9PSEU|nr:hypothetical protein [Kibdelosporangium philippinense]MCE7001459.1 hypothetical protein [Kibdelosporangium philippinense]
MKCVADHGVAARGRPATPNVDPSLKDKVKQDCDPLLPLPPWENDSSNPEAIDFQRKVVECLRGKGVKAEVKTSEDGTVGLSLGGGKADPNSIDKADKSIDQAMTLADTCEKEVFAGGRK